LTKAWGLLAIVGLLAALAVACGDGGEPSASGSPSATASPSASPSPTVEGAAPAACQALQALKAYRYSFNLKLESPEPAETPGVPRPTPTSTITREFTGPFLFEYGIEGSFVAPDRFEASFSGAGNPFAIIVVGDQAWLQTEGVWMPNPQATIPYKPADICQAILTDLDLLQVEAQEEKINDVKSLHYAFPQVLSEQAMAKIFGAQSDMAILLKTLDVDLWLAEKGNWPVRIDTSSSGLYADGRELRLHLLLDVKDANSGDIRVEPPS
jgi:hypothetical protein